MAANPVDGTPRSATAVTGASASGAGEELCGGSCQPVNDRTAALPTLQQSHQLLAIQEHESEHVRSQSGKPARLQRTETAAEAASHSAALLFAGACSGAASKLLTAPIDRLKIMYQVNPLETFSVRSSFQILQGIVQGSGPLALWRGNSAAMARDMPYAAVVFTSFAMYEEAITRSTGHHSSIATRLAAGSAAGATATCLTYPLDVLRARFAAELCAMPRDSSYFEAVKFIIRREGPSAFFSGERAPCPLKPRLRPSLIGIVPYSGLSFAAFETIKAKLRARSGLLRDEDLKPSQRLLAGGFAGLFAQTATYPLNVVRRRMQVSGIAGSGAALAINPSISKALRSIHASEGIANGLFKGLTLAIIKGPLQSAVGFAVNDIMKKQLSVRSS